MLQRIVVCVEPDTPLTDKDQVARMRVVLRRLMDEILVSGFHFKYTNFERYTEKGWEETYKTQDEEDAARLHEEQKQYNQKLVLVATLREQLAEAETALTAMREPKPKLIEGSSA